MARLDVLIEQGEWWVDRQLRRHRITGMEPRHARNSAAMLRRTAPLNRGLVTLHVYSQIERMPTRDYDHDPFLPDAAVKALLREDVRTWLETTPLMRALRHRGSCDGGEDGAAGGGRALIDFSGWRPE